MQAVDFCKGRKGRLPSYEDFDKLAQSMGRGYFSSYSPRIMDDIKLNLWTTTEITRYSGRNRPNYIFQGQAGNFIESCSKDPETFPAICILGSVHGDL